MNIKRAALIGTLFALIPIIIFLFTAKTCTSNIACLVLAFLPSIPIISIMASLGIDASKRILGIAAFAWISLIFWFLVGFLGTLLVQYIRSKIKK